MDVVITWVLVFVLWQFSLVLIINPIKKYKIKVSEMLARVMFFANKICNRREILWGRDENDIKKIEQQWYYKIRELSCELSALYYDIPWRKLRVHFNLIIPKDHFESIMGSLIWLSGSYSYELEANKNVNKHINNIKSINKFDNYWCKYFFNQLNNKWKK